MSYRGPKGLKDYRQRLGVYRGMFADVCNEPASEWMDNSHRRYALRGMAANLVKVDRMMIYGTVSSTRRKFNQWPPGARRILEREYTH
ncbi:hypothetical protein ACGTNG_12825 [Halomonas sp. 1390]|uniref:hypothetical protein n=1 Tax=Halomonas sp. B23F22_3 TaxID=3459516 RepID=UPI00373F5D8B